MPTTRKVRLKYEPLGPKQEAFHLSTAYERILIGGVDCGKTYACVAEMLSQLLHNPQGRGKTGLIIARTASHAKNQLLPIIEKILTNVNERGKPMGLIRGREYKVNYSSPITVELPFGSKVLIWSVEAGDTIKGLNVTWCYVDEITDMQQQHYDDAFDRVGRQGVPGGIWASGNPRHKGHWVYKRFFEKHDAGQSPEMVYCDYWTTYDNPLSQEKIQHYEQTYSYSHLERERKLMGRFVNLEGLCIPAFDTDKHLFDRKRVSIGKDWNHYAGLDFGERDPTAILRIAKDHDGQFWVYAEYYVANGSISEHSKYLLRQNFSGEHIERVYSDVYTETVTTYRENGVTNIEPYKKVAGSVAAGIAILNQLFLNDRINIASDCLNLIKELHSYEWKSTGQREEPKPGQGDHAIDALRYCITSLVNKPSMVVRSSATIYAPRPIDAKRQIFAYEADGTPIYLAA